jgi:putative transposase
MENLQVQSLTRSAKGSVNNPGTYVRQKSGLNRSILSQGWGMLKFQIAYKMEQSGGKLPMRSISKVL